MQRYCRILAEAAAAHPKFSDQIDYAFVDLLEACAPLHDVGRIAIPDHIVMKVGPLTPEERLTIETHTAVAADAFRESLPPQGENAFLRMASDIARSHHERTMAPGIRSAWRTMPSLSPPAW